jgi:hypothetical protein
MSRESECKNDELRKKISELDHAMFDIANSLELDIDALKSRVKALEALINARLAPDTAGHPNDGGWFD